MPQKRGTMRPPIGARINKVFLFGYIGKIRETLNGEMVLFRVKTAAGWMDEDTQIFQPYSIPCRISGEQVSRWRKMSLKENMSVLIEGHLTSYFQQATKRQYVSVKVDHFMLVDQVQKFDYRIDGDEDDVLDGTDTDYEVVDRAAKRLEEQKERERDLMRSMGMLEHERSDADDCMKEACEALD